MLVDVALTLGCRARCEHPHAKSSDTAMIPVSNTAEHELLFTGEFSSIVVAASETNSSWIPLEYSRSGKKFARYRFAE